MRGSSVVSLMFFLRCIAYLSSSLDGSSTFEATVSHKSRVAVLSLAASSSLHPWLKTSSTSPSRLLVGHPCHLCAGNLGLCVWGSNLCPPFFPMHRNVLGLSGSPQFAMRCFRMVLSGSFALRCDEFNPISLSFFLGIASTKGELLLI